MESFSPQRPSAVKVALYTLTVARRAARPTSIPTLFITDAAVNIALLLTGIAVTQVREDIRNVPIVARSAGSERLDPSRLADFSLMSRDGNQIPLDQIGHSEVRLEEPVMKRRDRTPVITIRSDINEATQPPEVSKQIMTALKPLIASLPAGYRIEMGGSIEEATKANTALGKIFPTMIAAMLIVIGLIHERADLYSHKGIRKWKG